jgi:hypothetical protein
LSLRGNRIARIRLEALVRGRVACRISLSL